MHGRTITGYEASGLMEEVEKTLLLEDVIYVVSVPELEALPEIGAPADGMYGGMSIQISHYNGRNQKLNAPEYHRDPEVSLVVTDMILLIGQQQDITEEYTYDTGLAGAFFVPARTLIEVYTAMPHYAPCQMDEGGFRCVIVLLRGTNEELAGPVTVQCEEDKLPSTRNK